MPSLTDDVLSHISGPALQQIASQLGIDPQQASSAINTALPLLVGKLGANASQPQGAQALLGALQNNHSGLDIGSVLSDVLGGGGAASNGAGIPSAAVAFAAAAAGSASTSALASRNAERMVGTASPWASRKAPVIASPACGSTGAAPVISPQAA